MRKLRKLIAQRGKLGEIFIYYEDRLRYVCEFSGGKVAHVNRRVAACARKQAHWQPLPYTDVQVVGEIKEAIYRMMDEDYRVIFPDEEDDEEDA